jgi:hypothetical protein
MASIDLKDAYYSVQIDQEHQKFLKFCYGNTLFKFTVFPNGLSTCPRKFTKLLKPPLAWLRINGHIIIAYIDDLYLQGKSFAECMHTIVQTMKLLEHLGFVVHPDKSVFIPSQSLTFLGFTINSKTMTITLTKEKIEKLKDLIKEALASPQKIKIRTVAKIIGHMVASLSAVLYGALYYRNIDRDKTNALKDSKGNFDKSMSISAKGIREMEWWYNHLDNSFSPITQAIIIDEVIYSDASLKGWGAAFGSQKTGGNWSCTEATSHINILELKAALFALESFRSQLSHKHVKIMVDNSAAVYMINKMGSSHTEIGNDMVVAIWEFCINNEIWLTAAHVPGSLNVIADAESRRLYTDAEWMLKPSLLHDALSNLQSWPKVCGTQAN